jgi:hypothetical protein
MRLFLVMLLSFLCIALPLQASATTTATGKHCPHMQDMAALSPADSNNHPDCCNDAATASKTGQLCKTGQECSPPVTYMLPPTIVLLALTSEVTQLAAIPVRTHTGPPSAVWRPPTLL